MKTLVIGGDRHVLEEGTSAHARFELLRPLFERLDVFVWPQMHTAWSIFRAARENRYDVITAQDPFWRGLLAWKMARLTGAKLNLQVHTDFSAQSFLRNALGQIMLRRADSVRVVSERIKQQVIHMGVRCKITVLPIFIDLPKFTSVVHRAHPLPTILWIGRYEKEKDPLLAISVLEEVRKAGINAQLVMLGQGSMQQEVIKRANNLPIIEVLTWQDPIIHFDTADVVLCTSRHESWGASIVEALAAGIPVVAPDVGVAQDAGAIVVPREELAETVVEVLKNGAEGKLKLHLLGPEEWAKRWQETLV